MSAPPADWRRWYTWLGYVTSEAALQGNAHAARVALDLAEIPRRLVRAQLAAQRRSARQ